MVTPFFLDSAGGRIHCTVFHPSDPTSATPGLVFLPPWAEEANKARRMMARLGHSLAGAGFRTLVPDFYGTGDSEGDFAEARWELWKNNARDARDWLRDRETGPVYLGGLRLGGLIAAETARELAEPPPGLLLWSPIINGRQTLRQFLRLRLAAGLGVGGDTPQERTADLLGRLEAGESLEVAGYELHPGLAGALDARSLQGLLPSPETEVIWLDVVSGPEAGPPPASRSVVEAWREQGRSVRHQGVPGDPFWATQELVDAPALVEASAGFLERLEDAEVSGHAP
ncbi:hydrolase 2, exosortase A system-associated [Thiohalorhabdus denitrificans]|uniref:Exosortase A system-associated hydrolase 2 n=1 Tax=Thiohalorhabdus denitrificans TaxID=381306 RepID=A0A1G5DDJ4_9GAMM|nr:hydrolase 2, exosortase A system-associated [Thiohalorhabdus denitrificans]SCY12833.1 exosortase A system-associated hydrolase 2 [Thiohalorhabdus denitrificans]